MADPQNQESESRWSRIWGQRYREESVRDNHFSPILWLGVAFVLLVKFVNLFELLKPLITWTWRLITWKPTTESDKGKTPAAALDLYLLILWIVTIAVGIGFDWNNRLPEWFRWLYLYTIIQVVQTNVYHELWRPELLRRRGAPQAVTYSRLRNLVIGFCNFIFVTSLFGLAYWKSTEDFGQGFPFATPGDAIYFSFTVAWTVGSESIPSATSGWFVEMAVIMQVIVTLFLVSILLAAATGSLQSTSEKPREKGEEQEGQEEKETPQKEYEQEKEEEEGSE